MTGENLSVLKRVIHTTADFDFVRNLLFSPNSVRLGREALRRGVTVVTEIFPKYSCKYSNTYTATHFIRCCLKLS